MAVRVSVIIPVYNSVNYVGEAIRSVQEQSLDRDAIEILAVDDGSTDGGGELLAEMAAEDPRIRLLTQENSGTPGGARNPAIDIARGEFVFFLDSDDTLTPDALRDMLRMADAEDSDVVLGKLGSLDARAAPASMFKRTVADADLVEDNIFNTLRPSKLIRRTLIDELELRFPTDQKVGEDQPFMAAAYLNARKVSILADHDYYMIRRRDDGTNMTSIAQTAEDQLRTAVRLSRAIERYTEPGELRDKLLRRPFQWTMGRALDRRWHRLPRAEQEALRDEFHAEIRHLYTDGVREPLPETLRWKLDLLAADDLDGLAMLFEHLGTTGAPAVLWRDGMFQHALPEELERRLPKLSRQATAPVMSPCLEDLRIDGLTVRVSATVTIPALEGAPDGLGIRGRRRDSEEVADFEVTGSDLRSDVSSFSVEAEHAGLSRGVWDLFVVVRFGEHEKEIRLGATRSAALAPEGVSNLAEEPPAGDRLIAYFTKGPGNLSIDRGGLIARHTTAVRSLGLALDENGRALLLIETPAPPQEADEFFCTLKGIPQHGGRQLLPTLRLGERLLGLRLPVTATMIGARLSIASVLGGVRSPVAVTGTEFWPARAAGFGLVAEDGGGVRVVGVQESTRRHGRVTHRPARAPRRAGTGRARLAAAVRAVPVAGPALTGAVRRARNRLS